MKIGLIYFQLACALSLSATACGDQDVDTAPGESGVAVGKPLTELTDKEASQLCDWSLATEGGAGKVTKCSDGSERQTHTKDECLENVATIRELALPCTITVGDLESCSRESRDACATSQPSCDRVNACIEQAQEKK